MATKSKKTSSKKGKTEEYSITGEELLKKVKKLIHEGNVRRIIVKNEKGKTLLEIPVTVAVVGVALAPVLAAVGALAALIAKGSLVVERRD